MRTRPGPRARAVALLCCTFALLAGCATPSSEPPSGPGGAEGGPDGTAPPAPVFGPGVEFSDGFEDDTTAAWLGLARTDGRIAVVDDPVRSGNHAVRLTADQDDFPAGENVRTQLNGPVLFEEGDEAYVGWSTYFPTDMTEIPPDVWFTFFEFHGEPFSGSPLPGTFDLENRDGQEFVRFTRAESYDYDSPWSMPMVKGQWIDFVVHVTFSKDDDIGSFELWVDGQQQTFDDGSTRLAQSTIMDDQDDGLFPTLTNYFKADSIDGPVTIYQDDVRVADTLEEANRH